MTTTAAPRIVPASAAYAVGRFRPEGPHGYTAVGVPARPLRATRDEALADWLAQVEDGRLPDVCKDRADYVRTFAEQRGLTGEFRTFEALAYRLAWDAPAASEFIRPVLADAADVEHARPDLADAVWHHAAGATILGTSCCGTPADHRDALVAMAATLKP